METKIMYQSKGKSPNGEPFLTVKQARGYYEYAERAGKDSIGFILYDKNQNKYAMIYESKPPLDESTETLAMGITAFGGSLDMNKNPIEVCQIEVEEESGYEVPIDNIHYIGKTLVSSQSSQLMLGYLVDVTNIKKTKKAENETSLSVEFNKNKVMWMSEEELFSNSDWKSIFILTVAKFKNII